ncbi:hypothetical protein QZH41_004561 [Actinostola sp. cb2023]|nr:hypothetical protein QZH41_004561 [Actinostola sp. cb2023]
MASIDDIREDFMINLSTLNNESLVVINSTARCELPYTMALTMFVINIVVSFLGTSGNILVCLAVLTTTNLQRISNYFICCLAIADLTINGADQPLLAILEGVPPLGNAYPNQRYDFLRALPMSARVV